MSEESEIQKLIDENRKILGPSFIEEMVKNPTFWKRFIFKTLPQGKGSGLDADTVDGYHADDFLQRLAVKHLAMGGGGGGTGATKFIGLTDVPNSYSGQSGKVAQVKATEDGLEFNDPFPAYVPSYLRFNENYLEVDVSLGDGDILPGIRFYQNYVEVNI